MTADPLQDWSLYDEIYSPHTNTDHNNTDMNSMNVVAPLDNKVNDPFVLTRDYTSQLASSIRHQLSTATGMEQHPVLTEAATHLFASTGKLVRPTMVLLLGTVLSAQPTPSQIRLAEISEMIHTASLFHDDVIDNADTRRQQPSAHKVHGNKVAILAGDFLLARSSVALARLRSVHAMEAMSLVIDHLIRGEVMQISSSNKTNSTAESKLEHYLRKTFYKTGSLMAHSCASAALLVGAPPSTVDACYRYGKHAGLAFQLVDDLLDFVGDEGVMGKPRRQDLKEGLATAPVLFSLDNEMAALMDRRFSQVGDVERACHLIDREGGMEKTRKLAQIHAGLAARAAMELPLSSPDARPYRDALVHLAAHHIVHRIK